MSEERSLFARRIDERKFSLSRRGYDKREVQSYLEDLEQAFRELEGHARRTAQRVADLERDLSEARASEKVSVDNAMMAVFDAKDRILERARRKADEIEEEAYAEASRIKSAAIADVAGSGGSGEMAAATAQAEEIILSARKEADRIRREAEGESARDLEAELDAVSAQLRIAHSDTAAAKQELDAARKRIVQLESGSGDAPSAGLEERFARLEAHLNAARDDNTRLHEDLASRDTQVATLEEAVDAAERAINESKSYIAGIEAEADGKNSRIRELEESMARLRAEVESRPEGAGDEGFGARLRAAESVLNAAQAHEDQTGLVDELMKANAPIDDDRVAELEGAITDREQRLAEARHAIGEMERRLAEVAVVADLDDTDDARQQAHAILAAARDEAKAIMTEAEEEAEQRAGKVVAKAREEADQVRQTVATLTAQADDARSAALRSKLEAEDLAETQRAIGEEREGIIASANSRAEEIEAEAHKTAEALRQQVDEEMAKARTEAEQKAAAIVAEAEERAAAIVEEAAAHEPAEPGDSGDELAAMLAAAEHELAVSAELRRLRAELDLREQELTERERALTGRRPEERLPQETMPELPSPLGVVAAVTPDAPMDEGAPVIEFDDDEDPAERLSALLEAAAPITADEAVPEQARLLPVPEPAGPVGPATGAEFQAPAAEPDPPRSRMAWPTPSRLVEVEQREGEHETEEAGPEGEQRESRYRSRSAQLPHLGNQAKSNMTTMANLRKKSRGSNND